MQLEPRRLLWLLAVHRAGGIHAAAQKEHVSASAISQQVARLEAEVGTRLLDRHPQGVTLTAAGRMLVESAERIEMELAESRRTLSALSGDPSGSVLVGAIRTVTLTLLIPLVARVHGRHPAVDVVASQVEGDAALRQLSAGELDVVVLEADSPAGLAARRGTTERVLLDDPWLLVTPKDVEPPRSVAELGRLTWLAVDEHAAAHAATNAIVAEFPGAHRSMHTYDDHDVAVAMVAAGLGVALVPRLAMARYGRDDVRIVALPGLGARRLLTKIRTPRGRTRPELAIVLEELATLAAEHRADA